MSAADVLLIVGIALILMAVLGWLADRLDRDDDEYEAGQRYWMRRP